MMKIAMLQAKQQRDRIFTEQYLHQLRKYGELALNEQIGVCTVEDMKTTIAGADIAITSWGVQPLTREVLDCAPNLKLVVHAAGTVKPIVTPELWDRGIRVTNCTAPLGRGVAETALGFTISALKNMWRLTQHTRASGWSSNDPNIRELYGVTIGVISGGRAGAHYIKLLQGFEVEVLLYDPFITADQAKQMGARKTELDELLALSDVVSIHAPSIPETNHMFNAERLQLMKDDCILINTARGSIIDEDALVTELSKGRLFACLDVTDPEPPRPDHPLRTLPNAILTPHIAGAVNNGLQRIAQYSIDELERFLAGAKLEGEVQAEQLRTFA